MKKGIIFGLVIILLLLYGYPGRASENKIKKNDVVGLLPESTEFMLKMGSVETVFTHFSVTEDSVFGEPVGDIEKIKAALGFNPLVISDLKSNGFDTGKNIGFLTDGFKLQEGNAADTGWKAILERAAFSSLWFIPVTDGRKAADKINALIKYKIPTAKFGTQGQFTVFEQENVRGYIFEKDKYLFIGMNRKADAKAFMESVAAGKTSLSDTQIYNDVTAKVNSGEEMFVYANIKKIVKNNLTAIQNISEKSATDQGPDIRRSLEYLKDCEATGISVDLEGKDFVAKSVFNMVPGSKHLNVLKNISFDKNMVLGLKENPVFLLSASVNAPEYYKMFLESLTQTGVKNFKEGLKKIKTDFGVDVEKEVIENLAGNLNLCAYDGASINLVNYNALLTLNIKDEAKMKAVMDKTVSNLSPDKQAMVQKVTVGSDEAYALTMLGMLQLYAGVRNNNLVLSSGKPMFEKAVKGNISSGFVAVMKDKALSDALKSNTSLFYVNIGEMFKAVKNFPSLVLHLNSGKPVDEKMSKAIHQFEYLLSTSRTEGNSIYSNIMIKTGFSEPFFRGVQRVAKESGN